MQKSLIKIELKSLLFFFFLFIECNVSFFFLLNKVELKCLSSDFFFKKRWNISAGYITSQFSIKILKLRVLLFFFSIIVKLDLKSSINESKWHR